MKQAVQITILGQQYTVRSEIPPEEVLRVAAFVNEWVSEAATAAGRSGDSLNTAVLALLNLGGAYLRLRDGGEDEASERLQRLLEKLEKACPPDSTGADNGQIQVG